MILGVTVGKFYPFHKGHDYLIREAKKKVDRLIVLACYNPHSADVAGIFLSVLKTWSPNAFGLNLCGFSVTGACQFYLDRVS